MNGLPLQIPASQQTWAKWSPTTAAAGTSPWHWASWKVRLLRGRCRERPPWPGQSLSLWSCLMPPRQLDLEFIFLSANRPEHSLLSVNETSFLLIPFLFDFPVPCSLSPWLLFQYKHRGLFPSWFYKTQIKEVHFSVTCFSLNHVSQKFLWVDRYRSSKNTFVLVAKECFAAWVLHGVSPSPPWRAFHFFPLRVPTNYAAALASYIHSLAFRFHSSISVLISMIYGQSICIFWILMALDLARSL